MSRNITLGSLAKMRLLAVPPSIRLKRPLLPCLPSLNALLPPLGALILTLVRRLILLFLLRDSREKRDRLLPLASVIFFSLEGRGRGAWSQVNLALIVWTRIHYNEEGKSILYDQPTHVGRESVDTSPTDGRLTANSRPTNSQVTADSRPTHGRHVSVGHKVHFY